MTTDPAGPARGDEGTATAPGAASGPETDDFAVSPDVGVVPVIYVPRSPARGSTGAGLWRATVRAALRTGRRAARHLPHHDLAAGRRARSEHTLTGEAMTDIPADLRYSPDHLWARPSAGASLVRVGVTDFAQGSLGDIVDVTLPRPGDTVKAGEACGDIESTKSVSDLVAPVSGTVRARNDDLAGAPELVNTEPYGQGWMFEVETDPATLDQQFAALMDAAAYRALTGA